MDSAAFVTWFDGIRRLDASQRRRVWRELALVEADLPTGIEEGEPANPKRPVAVAVAMMPFGAADAAEGAEPSLLAQIGRARLADFGCPHCAGDDVRPWGKASGKPRYRCVTCRKTFNPLTGTPLAGLHYPERWPDQAQALMDGETIAKAAKRCGVDYTTAFRWRHRFLKALDRDKLARLSGIVEADETFILESFKGSLPRAARKCGGKAGKRGPVGGTDPGHGGA